MYEWIRRVDQTVVENRMDEEICELLNECIDEWANVWRMNE